MRVYGVYGGIREYMQVRPGIWACKADGDGGTAAVELMLSELYHPERYENRNRILFVDLWWREVSNISFVRGIVDSTP